MKFLFLLLPLIFLSCIKAQTDKQIQQGQNIDISPSDEKGNLDISRKNEEFKSFKASTLNDMGVRFGQNKEYKKAEKNLLKALEFEPNHPTVLNNLGNIKKAEEDYEASIAYFKKSFISSDSLYYNALLNLGVVYANTEEYEESKKAYQYILTNSKDSFQKGITHYQLSKVYLKLRECEKANEHLEKSKRILKNHNMSAASDNNNRILEEAIELCKEMEE